jgi:hypothetical protein
MRTVLVSVREGLLEGRPHLLVTCSECGLTQGRDLAECPQAAVLALLARLDMPQGCPLGQHNRYDPAPAGADLTGPAAAQ